MKKLIKKVIKIWSLVVILLPVLTLMGSAPAVGDITNWQGAAGSWFDGNNWDNDVPTPTKDAYIENGGTAFIESGDATALSLWSGTFGNSSGTVTQTGGTLTISSDYNSLSLGSYESGNGYYNLLGGNLYAQDVHIGDSGTGTFTQTGGNHTTNSINLGQDSSGEGMYNLWGGSLVAQEVGIYNGEFLQKDGASNSVGLWFYVGATAGGEAKYTMEGGTLETFWEHIDNATFTQTGGNHTVFDPNSMLVVGGPEGPGYFNLWGGSLSTPQVAIGGSGYGEFLQKGEATHTVAVGMGILTGKYTLEGGNLSFGSGTWLQVGNEGPGAFTQTGGNVGFGSSPTTTNHLLIGMEGGSGSYSLQGDTATLTMDGYEIVGLTNSQGSFSQSGGTNSITRTTANTDGGRLLVGWHDNSQGAYELSGGLLTVDGKEMVGGTNGHGSFVQSGGTNIITGTTVQDGVGRLLVGWPDNSIGTYELSGGLLKSQRIVLGDSDSGTPDQPLASGQGTLTVSGGRLEVEQLSVGLAADQGNGGFGKLDLASAEAYVEVSERLWFGGIGQITAVEGATIHMTGSEFRNTSTSPANLAGLSNLTLSFEGVGHEDLFEVAGTDYGASSQGYNDNFALDTLKLEADTWLRLADIFDNNGVTDDIEALYAYNLVLGEGATLDLDGINLYYQNITDLGAIFEDGSPQWVPVPGELIHYDFTCYYDSGAGDSYTGSFYTYDIYAVGNQILPFTDENGQSGYYEITDRAPGSDGVAGQVFVDSYTDFESGEPPYTESQLMGYGTPVGSNLGSESDYIIMADVPEYLFGGSFYEADLVAYGYDFTFTYTNSDYYTGTVYAEPERFGITPPFNLPETETGTYAIVGIPLPTDDVSLADKVFVSTYYNDNYDGTYTEYLTASEGVVAVGTAGLSSEYDYLILEGVPEYYFGNDVEVANPAAVCYAFTYQLTYNNGINGGTGDYYTGVVYAEPELYGIANTPTWTWTISAENSLTAFYTITSAEPGADPNLKGTVTVDSYYDMEMDRAYVPTYFEGSDYLGSEYGFIVTNRPPEDPPLDDLPEGILRKFFGYAGTYDYLYEADVKKDKNM